MRSQSYKEQLGLLLDVLPEVAKEDCFAIHGGTAINLFVRDMPRLSVDIDLTYLPVEGRQVTLHNIDLALKRITERLYKRFRHIHIDHRLETGKLLIRSEGVGIKVEVNLIGRGVISSPSRISLCEKAQTMFDVVVTVPVVPFGQLYGGKVCAALDRQHPRDLFDIRLLLDNEGFSDEIHRGFLLCLLSSDRPMNELLRPNLQDQKQVMQNQFAGMSDLAFSYTDFEETRRKLVELVNETLTDTDKDFLLSVHNCEPNWGIHDFERFPAVQWKLQNLQKLKERNPDKHRELYQLLTECF